MSMASVTNVFHYIYICMSIYVFIYIYIKLDVQAAVVSSYVSSFSMRNERSKFMVDSLQPSILSPKSIFSLLITTCRKRTETELSDVENPFYDGEMLSRLRGHSATLAIN